MYAMSEDRARPPGPGRAEHELPVLFHLMDVSRNRPTPPEASPPPQHTIAAVEAQLAPAPASQNVSSVDATLLPQPATTRATCELSLPPPNTHDSVALPLEPASAKHSYPVSDTLLAAVTSQVGSSGPAITQATETSDAQAVEKPKNQLASRRKHKTAASEDWFASHGKYIAIGFVLALIGTIWVARGNRQQSNSTAAASPTKSLLADEPPGAPSITIPAAGSAHSTVLVSADSQVELHPPTTSHIAAGAKGDGKDQGKDKLFDFPATKGLDERIATRPDGGASEGSSSIQRNAAANPVERPTPQVTPPPPGAPALSPAYPTTSPAAPPLNYPAAVAPTGSYPQTSAPPLVGASPAVGPPPLPAAGYSVAPQGAGGAAPNYRSQFPVPAGAAAPQPPAWTASPSGANLPGQYQSFDHTARGPRNERTGSGNY
jgi:hypothetical protein